MKKMAVLFLGLFLLACGGPAENQPITLDPAPVDTEAKSAPVTPTPVEAAPAKPKPIQRVASNEISTKCRYEEQEDGTQMVVSEDKDWFLYVPGSAQIECNTFGGKVKIVDGGLTLKVEALIPRDGGDDNIEKELRDQAATFIKSEVSDKYGIQKGAISFDESKIGKSKRKGICTDAVINMAGMEGRLVACVTSKKNINDEVVVHRAYWIGSADQYDAKETVALVKNAASAWFRYSDTDMTGKILNKW